MRAVIVDVPESLLEERRRKGIDLFDEMWEGLLHMVPPPSDDHQSLAADLFTVLRPLAEARGLLARYESGLYAADDDWRVPDQIYCSPERRTERGMEGPVELVVEILSPGDETYDKLHWYARLGVGEVLVVHPATRVAELFVNRGGRMVLVQADAAGEVAVGAVAVRLATVAGPGLHVVWEGGSATV